MKKLASCVAILALICWLIPSLTFAVWWNPFSWFETANNIEISMEISSSTPSASAEIKTESNWWNPLSWVKKEKIPKQENVSQENLASTTADIISENDGLESDTTADLELKTAQAKAEAEKYKLQAEQAKLETEKLKQENESKIQTQTETQKIEAENKNTIITLPNGGVIEMDEYGNIVRTIQEAPIKPAEPTQTTQQTAQQNNQNQSQNIIPKIELSAIENSLSAIPSTNQQLLIQFKITTKDTVEISKSIFKINTSSGYGKISDITSAFLIDQNGSIVAGPVDGSGGNNGVIEFTDIITLKKGDTDYKLKANIGSAFTDNPNFYVSIDVDTWEIK